MKRSYFKRKPTTPLKKTELKKKTPIKRKSKSPIRKIQDELWAECKRITRLRYIKKDGTWNCYTCDHVIDQPKNAQTGHFIPNACGGALLRYHLGNLRIQCYRCNIDLSGNGSEFYRRLVIENGQQHVDDLFLLKEQTTKAVDHYIKLLAEYKLITR